MILLASSALVNTGSAVYSGVKAVQKQPNPTPNPAPIINGAPNLLPDNHVNRECDICFESKNTLPHGEQFIEYTCCKGHISCLDCCRDQFEADGLKILNDADVSFNIVRLQRQGLINCPFCRAAAPVQHLLRQHRRVRPRANA